MSKELEAMREHLIVNLRGRIVVGVALCGLPCVGELRLKCNTGWATEGHRITFA
jgi:hypothetical protein